MPSATGYIDYKGSAVLSEDGIYRYELRRRIGPEDRACVFVMLNPSTADAERDDPTIRRCMGFAKAWGCGELIVVNLFAYRATNPMELRTVSDPVGPDNMEFVKEAAHYAAGNVPRNGLPEMGLVVCAWGNHGKFMGQADTVLGWLDWAMVTPHCLRMTGAGQPAHPLYLSKNLSPTPMSDKSDEPT